MKVLHIAPALFGPGGVVGGGERYALELARHMASRVQTRLLVFADAPGVQKVGSLDVHVARASGYVGGQRSNPFSAAILTHVRWADVVHCHQQHVLASSVAAVVSRCTARKVFVTDLGGGGWDVSAYVSTDRWYHGHLHISEYSRRIAGHEGKPWAHVISGGVDTERFSPSPERARDGSVVFVGRLLPHKGVDVLVDALPPDVPLKIIGRPLDEAYVGYLRERAAGKNVVFRHDAGDDEVISSYRSAACVVLPSVYRSIRGTATKIPELLGQTLLEAMACGTVVVGTDVASLPEVVNEDSGFLVPPNDPLALRERLLWIRAHPEQAEAMGRAGRQRVLDTFTWKRVVDRCLGYYKMGQPPF